MRFFRRSHTRSLTAVSLELAVRRRHRLFLAIGIVLLGGSLLAFAGFRYLEAQRALTLQRETLEKENLRLREDSERARLALEVEKATRDGLEKQISELNEQFNRLKSELEFFRSQKNGRR